MSLISNQPFPLPLSHPILLSRGLSPPPIPLSLPDDLQESERTPAFELAFWASPSLLPLHRARNASPLPINDETSLTETGK